MSVELFNRLVKLAARAFYDDITTKGDNQPKSARSDNRGIAVVILDALTRRQWVREEDLAKDLKLHSKQLRRTLRFFEEEKLITRDHRKETAKGAKLHYTALAATADVQRTGREGDDKIKMHTHSYCCLDYAQIYDVVRYRVHRMTKKLKDELENKDNIQNYKCPNCWKRYNALDAPRLISPDGGNFHCESCNGELVEDNDKLTTEEIGDGDDSARKHRHEKLKNMLQKMEAQLKPLKDLIDKLEKISVPEFGTLQAWEVQASAASRAANGDSSANDPSRSSQGLGGTPMPFVGETKVEVAFSGIEEKGENIKSESGSSPMKVLPPWMIKQGMSLTKEQRGEVKQEPKIEGTSAPISDDKKTLNGKDDVKNLHDEYLKAYYAALLQRQQEQEAAVKREPELSDTNISNGVYNTSSYRQVGMKFKRQEDDGEGDDVEWEEAPTAANTDGSYKVNDLNVQADASGDDEDDIDWEEG